LSGTAGTGNGATASDDEICAGFGFGFSNGGGSGGGTATADKVQSVPAASQAETTNQEGRLMEKWSHAH